MGAVPLVGLWDATKINKESRPAEGEGDGEVSRRARQALDESGNSLPQLSAVFNANFATDWQSQPGSATKNPSSRFPTPLGLSAGRSPVWIRSVISQAKLTKSVSLVCPF